MTWQTFLAIYLIIWWTVLFAVLPWGVRSQEESGEVTPGTDPGAPVVPALAVKALWTTIVSAVLFALFYALYASRLVMLDDVMSLWGLLNLK